MKLLSASRATLFVTFCCVFVIPTINCESQSAQDGDSKNSRVITSREEATDDVDVNQIGELLQFLLENFAQPTTGDRQVSGHHATSSADDHDSKNKFAISGDQLPPVTDSKKSGSNRLIRRSASESENNTSAPDTDSTSKSDEESRKNKNSNSGPKKSILGLGINPVDSFDNQNILNISNIFKNGLLDNIDIGFPPRPIKKILSLMMDRLKPKSKPDEDDQRSNERFPRKSLKDGKNLLGNVKENLENLMPLGIHRTFKLGPWTVSFDMGKP